MNTQTIKETNMEMPKVVSHEQWLKARLELLAAERELTHQRDALARRRRALPWERVGKNYVFDAPEGQRTLAEPTDDDLTLFRVARSLLREALAEDLEQGRVSPVRLVGVSASGLQAGAQLGLFDSARASRLNAALDAVRSRFGDDALDRASARDTERRRFSDRRERRST